MSISEIISDIDKLIPTTEENLYLIEKDAFLQKLNEMVTNNTLDHLKVLTSSLLLESPFQDEQWWKYICYLMEKLLVLKSALSCANEKDSLLSLNQTQTIKSALEILVSAGILAHLSPGIGFDLEQRSKLTKDILSKSNSQQKYYCLNVVLRCLMSLREEETTLKRLIVSFYIGDYLAAIFQLILESADPKLIHDHNNKVYLETQLSCLLEETPQPTLIKELMLLNGNKNCPPKLARALRLIMTERLMKENGVISTIKAILDKASDQSSPNHWSNLSVIAKLIATPPKNQASTYRDQVYPQILKLLSTDAIQFARIATLCISTVHDQEPEECRKYFIDKICSPFLTSSTEEAITSSIECLYNCIVLPSSELWSLSISLFRKIYISLFRLYCFIVDSACYIKNKVKLIVLSILSKDMDYKGFVFGKVCVKFCFGENGGVFSELNVEELDQKQFSKDEIPWDDISMYTDVLLDLMEDDSNKVKLFQAVLSSLETVPSLSVESISSLEVPVVGALVLSKLCTEQSVVKWIEENPKGIVNFIISLLENDCEDDGENENDSVNDNGKLIRFGLSVLSALLIDGTKKDWHVFDTLVEPLQRFKSKKSNNVKLRVLADDIYCMIVTRGAVKKNCNDKKQSSTVLKAEENQYSLALRDVNDPLLPVKGHAIIVLGKLIIARDPEALKNKELILCIFKENLKCDDSYVYLPAIEGLASLAGMFPDDVLNTLTEQFVCCKELKIRLEVGEVLKRVIIALGEMAAVYKNEIINALLFCCRDSDHLVRASSLSTLSELCRVLSFRLHAFLREIFECIRSILETDTGDKGMEPRRAAVLLVNLLLKGLGTDAMQVLDSILLDIYRLLKRIYTNEKDDITKLHAQLAIEELNESTIRFLTPSQDLKKHIFVLHPPK